MRDNRTGVVLVHGFKSGPVTWDPFRLLAARDPELAPVTAIPFEYATGVWTANPLQVLPSLDTVADSLKDFIDTSCHRFERLVLVSHSQGGLVIQRFLARMAHEGRASDLPRVRRIVMLACPNSGAEIALTLRRLLVRRNPQEAQLRPLNEQVADTQRTVLRDFVNAREITDRTCPIPFSVYAGASDNIVPAASARGVFPDAAALPGDHFTIVKTDSPTHRTYQTLRRLILLASVDDPPSASTAAVVGSTAPDGTRHTDVTDISRETYPLPDLFAMVAAAERIADMDDPEFRRSVIQRMRVQLSPVHGFTASHRPHMRDHLVEILQRCLNHRDPRAALNAFVGAVASLRPEEKGTADLQTLMGGDR